MDDSAGLRPQRGFPPKLLRYMQAGIGPVASAGAQFLLSVTLLRLLAPEAFGSFAFLLIASQFSWGLWSALFCAPLAVLLTQEAKEDAEQIERCMLSTNLVAAVAAVAVFWIAGMALAMPSLAALIFAIYGGVALLRWFARAHAYTTGAPLRTMASDLAYAGTLLAGVAALAASGAGSLVFAYSALLAGAVIGMLPFGWRYLVDQFLRFRPRSVSGYASVWRRHSGWSLLGVITTEATANAHAYLVTGLAGPTAFAPIAASALLIRPIGVAQKALNDFERAQMARQIGAGEIQDAVSSVATFRWVMMAAWLATVIAAGLVLFEAPRLLFPEEYDLQFMTAAAALWLGVAGMRLIRAPEGSLLQAAGQFRILAFGSIWSAGVSISAVLLLLLLAGPLWSILGVLMGEMLFAGITYFQARRWRTARLQEAASALPDEQESVR